MRLAKEKELPAVGRAPGACGWEDTVTLSCPASGRGSVELFEEALGRV